MMIRDMLQICNRSSTDNKRSSNDDKRFENLQ